MPYAPTVNDRSGEILAQHQINAANMLAGAKVSSAETRAAGNEALTKGIVDGATSAIGGITGGIMQNYNKSMETAAKKDGNMGTGSALAEIFKTYGSEDQYNTFMAGWQENSSNPDREAGYIAMHQKTGQALMQMAQQNNQVNAWANYRANAPGGTGSPAAAAPTPKYDFNYAIEFNRALNDSGITDPAQRKQKFNEAGFAPLWDKFIEPPKQNSFFGN